MYDGVGNRIRATRNGVQKQYVHDAGGNLIAEADHNGNITRYYIYAKGLTAMVTAGGAVYVYHFDGTGHTVAMTNSARVPVNKYAYSAYGEILGQQEEGIAQPFKYAGQVGIFAETGNIYYMRARYYDAGTGRFISEDPAGFIDGPNLYAYVGGNPVNAVDPSGLCPWCVAAGVGALIGGTANAAAEHFDGGSITDVLTAFGVGALAGGAFGATGGVAGSIGTWMATGAASGGLTSGLTTAATGGTAGEAITDAIVGAGVGALAGGLGHRVAVNSAVAAVKRVAPVSTAKSRGDNFGMTAAATTGVVYSAAGK